MAFPPPPGSSVSEEKPQGDVGGFPAPKDDPSMWSRLTSFSKPAAPAAPSTPPSSSPQPRKLASAQGASPGIFTQVRDVLARKWLPHSVQNMHTVQPPGYQAPSGKKIDLLAGADAGKAFGAYQEGHPDQFPVEASPEKQAGGMALNASIALSGVAAPVRVATGLAAYMGVDELENGIVSHAKKEPYKFQEGKDIAYYFGLNGASKELVGMLEFIAKGMLSGGIEEAGRGVLGNIVSHLPSLKEKFGFLNEVAKTAKETGRPIDKVAIEKRKADLEALRAKTRETQVAPKKDEPLPESKVEKRGEFKETSATGKEQKVMYGGKYEWGAPGQPLEQTPMDKVEEAAIGLRPSVVYENSILPGDYGQTHPDVLKDYGIPEDAPHDRGFINDVGKHIDREGGKDWVKENEPEVDAALTEKLGEGYELHSEDYNAAKGAQGATEKGQEQTGNLGQHIRAGEQRLPTEAGGSDSVLEGGQVEEEAPAKEPELTGVDRWKSPTATYIGKETASKMPAGEWLKRVEVWGKKDPHVGDENKWSGLPEWLATQEGKPVKKEDVQGFIEASKGKWAVRTLEYGGDIYDVKAKLDKFDLRIKKEGGWDKFTDAEKEALWSLEAEKNARIKRGPDPWASHNIPGGIKGTERVYTLSLPNIEYEDPHFPGKKGVIIHLRTQLRYDTQGRKGMIMETGQSTMHQQRGASQTVDVHEEDNRWYAEVHSKDGALVSTRGFDSKELADAYKKEMEKLVAEPLSAPFERSWPEVALKHALDIAAQDPEVEWVAWPDGKVQNERWGKTGQVSTEVYDLGEGKWGVANEHGDVEKFDNKADATTRANDINKRFGSAGDTFLNNLYDKRLPKFAKEYTKKIGGSYAKDALITDHETASSSANKEYGIHYIELTDKMREHINTKGQFLYSFGIPVIDKFFAEFAKTPIATKLGDLAKRLFTPEAISTNARKVDAMLAKSIIEGERAKDVLWKAHKELAGWWDKQGPNKGIEFMVNMEEPDRLTEEQLNIAAKYRDRLNDVYKREVDTGVDYNYRTEYFPHIFTDHDAAQDFIQKRIVSLGKDRFTKEREIDLLRDALKAGLQLKTTNPEEAVLMRELSAETAIMKQTFINRLIGMNLATNWEPDMKGSRYIPIDGPDGHRYGVPKDIYPVINNGLLQSSLWSDPSLKGDIFKAASKVKNLLVPIKLALSGFHAVHEVHISMSARIAQALENKIKGGGTVGSMLKEFGKAYTGMHQREELGKGWSVLKVWDKPDAEITPDEAQAIQYIVEGGGTPKMSEVWRSGFRAAFTKAIHERKWGKVAIEGVPAAIDSMQYPLFEMYIPALKTGSYLHDVDLLLKRQPELLDNSVNRGVELRKLWKSADDRFGEVVYKTLFMNKMMKEAGIFSSLSMGWNIGNVRQLGGGILDTAKLANKLIHLQKPVADDLTRKMLFTWVYTMNAALVGGLTTYAMTGQRPKEYRDYFFPKTGDKNTDGTDARFNMPFSTRDFFSLGYHIDKDGLLGGTSAFISGKANPMLGPISQLWHDEDYFHREVYSEDDPMVKQAWDVMKFLGDDVLSPISKESYDREHQLGMSRTKSFASTALGFNIAPKYVTNTAVQNGIANMAEKRFRGVKPIDTKAGQDTEVKIRNLYQLGKDDEADDMLQTALGDGMITEGQAKAFVKTIDLPGDVRTFMRLEASDQKRLLKHMDINDFNRYVWSAHKDVQEGVEDISAVGKRLVDAVEKGEISAPVWERGKMVKEEEKEE